jgi:hypothetical protein
LVGSGEEVHNTYVPNKIIPRNAGLDFLVDQTLKTDGKSGFGYRKIGSNVGTRSVIHLEVKKLGVNPHVKPSTHRNTRNDRV